MTTRRARRPLLHAAAVAALTLTALPGAAAAEIERPGSTQAASVAPDGAPGDGHSGSSAISGDGRYVAFHSAARNLGAGPTNGRVQVYVRDLETGATEMVSVSSGGVPGDGDSQFPDLSADGRLVVFSSVATNLVPDDTNDARDAFVHDRFTGETRRVSVASDGTQADGTTSQVRISGDGSTVVFASSAPVLTGDAPSVQVFAHDLDTGVTEMVSVPNGGGVPDGPSQGPAVNADGRVVAFQSLATNLVAGVTNSAYDVYTRDRDRTRTERVSVGWDNRESNGASNFAALNADGRVVAFTSTASNLVPLDDNGFSDVFVRDLQTWTIERVSIRSSGGQTRRGGLGPALSGDGRLVTFSSTANDIDDRAGSANDIYLHDRRSGVTRVVSLTDDGGPIDLDGTQPDLSADGRHVSFTLHRGFVPPGEPETIRQVLVRDAGPPEGLFDVAVEHAGDFVQTAGRATYAGKVIAQRDAPAGMLTLDEFLSARLRSADITYRPERGDLLLRWHLTNMEHVHPGLTFAFELEAGGVRYRAHAAFPLSDYTLHRCDPACVPVADLAGGYGMAGPQVSVEVPLDLLGLAEGDALTGLRAASEPRYPASATAVALHEVTLADTTIPDRRVEVELWSERDEPELVAAADAQPAGAAFAAELATGELEPGSYRLDVAVCLGDDCATTPLHAALTIED